MIIWEEEGIIIGTKRHGERSFIYHIFTKSHGRYAGLLRGQRSISAPFSRGAYVKARWSSRLSEHLGEWKLDPLRPLSFEIFNDYNALRAFDLVCHYLRSFLSERSAYPGVYAAFETLMGMMACDGWLAAFAHFELSLLKELGFGLKLDACAVTGAVDDLAYVSPRSGRAVQREIGVPYHDKIMTLPRFLIESHAPTPDDIRDAFTLTGFFLRKHFDEQRFEAIFKVRDQWIEHIWNNRSTT